ncbi:NUDIX domain-containing protein [Candidatus Nomurabacteria bacterium]|nr:NUDIX domain-containing protein [Candidatus Nomurabacteria bacterium]
MQSKDDTSYGVIPIMRVGHEWKVFLIHQFSRIGDNTYWILPKGHPVANETAQETAVRELKEETGMTPEKLIEYPTFKLKYKFMYEGVQINKSVIYYVGIIKGGEYVLQEDEVVEAGWYSLEEASLKLDYNNAKKMFKKAKEFIKTYEAN